MGIVNFSAFTKYKNLIRSLPLSFTDEMIKSEPFLLEKDDQKKLEMYYAPFDYVNESAKVMIVGITPGLHQMKRSFSTVIDTKDKSMTDEEILQEVKKRSSFEGPMRINLVRMLDELGLHEYLGLSSTMELFNKANDLVHTTSVIKYPVFYNGKNYSGTTPSMIKNETLKKYVVNGFAEEIKPLDRPLIIPLGVNVSKVLDYLTEHEELDPSTTLTGFPHPSGGNGHRHRQFAENKEQMKEMIKNYFSKRERF